MNPIVGVTTWRRELNTFYGPEDLTTLSTFYTDAAIDAGMVPMLFTPALDPSEAARVVSLVDGVILSGGDDVDPASYGAEPTHSKHFYKDVDDFELAVVEAARNQNKPLLAICRGLQLLNVALGGTLSQEVTEAGGTHELISTDHIEMNARRHVVHFEEDSIVGSIYGSSEAKVNTLHHQGVDRLADGLIVEGRTDDGLVEAARCEGSWWAVGVQWHPERMDGDHRKLFEAFRDQL